MLNWIFEQLAVYFSGFNVFRYITFRAICGIVTAMVVCFLVGPRLIYRLDRLQISETIRSDGPPSHHSKMGTPTMGGIIILIAILVPTFLLCRLNNIYVIITIPIIYQYFSE